MENQQIIPDKNSGTSKYAGRKWIFESKNNIKLQVKYERTPHEKNEKAKIHRLHEKQRYKTVPAYPQRTLLKSTAKNMDEHAGITMVSKTENNVHAKTAANLEKKSSIGFKYSRHSPLIQDNETKKGMHKTSMLSREEKNKNKSGTCSNEKNLPA